MKEAIPLSDYYAVRRQVTAGGVPFHNGDEMDQKTFHRLYKAAPEGFHAELVNGTVFFKMPITLTHSLPHGIINAWLSRYASATPGTRSMPATTLKLDSKSEPEPDALLIIDRKCGGRTSFSRDDYLAGPPELVIEISNTTTSYDLGAKKNDYERAGIQEYLIVLPLEKTVQWFHRVGRAFEAFKPDRERILRSRVFPGLWMKVNDPFASSTRPILATLKRGLNSPEHGDFVTSLARYRRTAKRPGQSKNGSQK